MKSFIQYLTGSTEPNTTTAPNPGPQIDGRLEQRARYMAEQICAGFQYHDRDQRADAVDAFYAVDVRQFKHIGDADARTAARAYADALWEKDAIEKAHIDGGDIDPQSIGDADWDRVRDPLVERADAVGMAHAYATDTAEAWRRHKSEEDYWTPFLRAQLLEYRVAIGDDSYPDKPNEGLSGFGPEPFRYATGVELHDLHERDRWEEAIQVMMPYYLRILRAHEESG